MSFSFSRGKKQNTLILDLSRFNKISMGNGNGGPKANRLSSHSELPLNLTSEKGSSKRCRYRRSKSATAAEIPSFRSASTAPPKSIIPLKLRTSSTKVIAILAIYLAAGTLCFYLTLHQMQAAKKRNGVVDALYFSVVTMSTVGYGDIVPRSTATKLLDCTFALSGMALVALGLSKVADYLVEKQETLVFRALHGYRSSDEGMLKEMETNDRVRHKCLIIFLLLVVLMVGGTTFLWVVEGLSIVDSFYCVCCTITTLGYGDVSFRTEGGRVFAVVWILAGTVCLAQFFLYLAELNTERRQRKLVKWVLDRKMTTADLEVADLDDDRVVDVSDFIVYKLKEMGKINPEDISLVMKEFEELDVDQSGALSAVDLTLPQPIADAAG